MKKRRKESEGFLRLNSERVNPAGEPHREQRRSLINQGVGRQRYDAGRKQNIMMTLLDLTLAARASFLIGVVFKKCLKCCLNMLRVL